MSYNIALLSPVAGEILEVPHFEEGGTRVLGGTNRADLNVTYNYARHFNFRGLHNRPAGDTIDELAAAVATLGTEQDDDYWAATPGNAGYAANILLGWARLHPHGVWEVV